MSTVPVISWHKNESLIFCIESFSSAMNYSSTPKGLKTGSNLSGGFSNRNKSWNMTPQPSSFRAPKDTSSSSKFINTANHRTSHDNKSLSKFLDSRLDTKDRSTVEDSSYFDSLKLFTEEGDMSIMQSARRKSTELNASLKQQLLRSAGGSTAQPKTTMISKANSAKNLKPPMERHERPASSQFGKAVNSGGKSLERTVKLNKTKTNSEGGSSSPSKILFTNWKDVEDNLTIPGTPSKMEDDERISLKDIIRLGSKTPQPDSAGHSFTGGNDLMKQLIKEKEQDKKTIKALQEQVNFNF